MSKENKVIVVSYDQNLNRLGVIDVFRSLIWTRKYYECGTFELHAPLNTRNLQLLAENNILSKREFKDKNGHIVKTTSKESGIVEYIAIDDTVNEITAKGRFLSSIMDRRAIKTVVNFNGKTEAGMRKLVQSVTAMPFVELGELKGFTETVRFQVSYKELYTYMCKLSKYSNLGFTIRADFKAKKFFFEVYKGVDRTESQRERSRVVFSEIYKNLNGVAYVFSNQNTKTCAIVAGEMRKLVQGGGVSLSSFLPFPAPALVGRFLNLIQLLFLRGWGLVIENTVQHIVIVLGGDLRTFHRVISFFHTNPPIGRPGRGPFSYGWDRPGWLRPELRPLSSAGQSRGACHRFFGIIQK